MAETYLICPNANNCEIYNNWKSQVKNRGQDVIVKDSNDGYSCAALNALLTGGNDIKDNGLLAILSGAVVGCATIELLNNSLMAALAAQKK